MPETTVCAIVIEYLRAHGYDGLYSDDCGCSLDDLMPCWGEDIDQCRPGVRGRCDLTDENGICEGCAEGKEHMGPRKEDA
jgi:hypothetical protein